MRLGSPKIQALEENIMERPVRWYDYITININWFALTARSQTLTPLIIPLLVQQFVGEQSKGTYVGVIRLWALMFAVLVQAFMGILSDHSALPWGRRRPFIFVGTLGEIIVFVLIGLIADMQGMAGYWVLFGLYILSMLSSNASHAATQGLIPDLAPEEKRGLFSGVKTLFELPLPLIFVSFVISKLVARGNMWGALGALSLSMLVAMAVTMLVRERPLATAPSFKWGALWRLFGMTAVFTLIILASGEVVQWFTALAKNLPTWTGLLLVGLAGLAGMAVAIGLGVWLSLRISIGAEFLKQRSYTWWVVNRLAYLVAITNLATFLVFFVQERFPELSAEKAAAPAANVVMFVGVFILLTAVPSGWLGDRFGKKRLIAISGVLAAIGTLIVVLTPGLTMLYVGGCVIGAGAGLFYSVNWALGTEIVPQEKAGQFLGMQNLAGAGAGAIGAYIGGPIADNTSYVLLMGIYALLFILSLIPLIGVEEKRN
jgi:MFS family permease